ncbi:MAG: hypothetical protein NZV14_05880 [Bryobacteraceae bacterium]|nr:hypothetical protein [Bryobacteraceae bacterium]MDW8377669.1 hypothetical protein [Bryobacterales bacterium]
MFVTCPACGSRHVRHSKSLSVWEKLVSVFGRYTLRCKDCHHRFATRVWKFADLRWTRCPRCYRTDLTTWSEEHYVARWRTQILLSFGAKRVRCEACRFNFAAFRPVKERYRFPRARKDRGQAVPVPQLDGETVTK